MTATKDTDIKIIVDISFALILTLPIAIAGGNILMTSADAFEAVGKCDADVNRKQSQECVIDDKRKRVERIIQSTNEVVETYRYTNMQHHKVVTQ